MLWGWYYEELLGLSTDGTIFYCAYNTGLLPNLNNPISADGTFIYCAHNIGLLQNLNDPIPADGIIIYCSQNTSGLPTP
jgi:hypothetical protein